VSALLKCLAQKPKGIFVEKPLSHSLKGLAQVQKLAKKNKTTIVVGYNLQFFKPLLEIKKLLQKNTIGKVLAMRVSVGQDLKAWRKSDYRKSYSADPKRGGGVILDLVHDFNYPAWLLGEPLKLVAGISGHISSLKIKTEDTAEGIFTSPSGVVVSVHQDYLQVPGRRYCEIAGEKGTIVWEWVFTKGATSTIAVHTPRGTKKQTINQKDKNKMYIDEVRAFIQHVQVKNAYTNLPEAIRDMHNALALRAKRYV
jgi:predicted dehydrogenase